MLRDFLRKINHILNRYTPLFLILALLGEFALNFVIIKKVKYTEIDHIAYMQEVGGFLNGEWDYYNIKGDTGPCVYPAGFIWIFSVFKILLGQENVLLFQYLFMGIYLLFIFTLFYIYLCSKKNSQSRVVPVFWIFFTLCISHRIHSIFVLRLFNDCVTMLFMYLSIVGFIHDEWLLGCIIYSIALSIKMNVLLFLPGILVLLTKKFHLWGALKYVVSIAIVQLFFAVPFLIENASHYQHRAFEFSRKFFYKWTVNFKMIPESWFLDDRLHKALLISTVVSLFLFAYFRWCKHEGGPFNILLRRSAIYKDTKLSAGHIVQILFESNFIGMVFNRSMHFQFYVWYYHTLPFLIWSTTLPVPVKLILLFSNEYVWNVYPANAFTSSLLHLVHFILLFSVFFSPVLKPQKKDILTC